MKYLIQKRVAQDSRASMESELSEVLHGEVGKAGLHDVAVGHAVEGGTQKEANLHADPEQGAPVLFAQCEVKLDDGITGRLQQTREPAEENVTTG